MMTMRKAYTEAVRRVLGVKVGGRCYAEVLHAKRWMKVKLMGVAATEAQAAALHALPDVVSVRNNVNITVYFMMNDDDYTAAVIETHWRAEARRAARYKRERGR